MRKPITQRISELEEQREALQSRLDKRERAQETRRKILLGTFLLNRLEPTGMTHDTNDVDGPERLRLWLARELPAFLTSEADRDLFADLLCPDNGRGKEDETGKMAESKEDATDNRGDANDGGKAIG